MICKCVDCGKPMSTVIEYKKEKQVIPKKWGLDGEFCINCFYEGREE